MKKKKVTMQQIADRVGVSKFAVSKALSGKPGISAATRERIFQVASQLGYVHHYAKTKQVKSKDDRDNLSMGILIPDIRNQNRESFYWGKILDGITQRLNQLEIGSIILTDNSPKTLLNIINPDGLMGIVGVGEIATPLLLELRHLSLAFVLVDHEDDLVPSDSVFMNNFDCTRKAANYLLGLGHQNLQFIGNIDFSRSFYDRWLGFKRALEENKIPYTPHAPFLKFNYTDDDGIAAYFKEHIHALSEQSGMPTAFVCANDHFAKLSIRALSELGIEVPRECSVVGFDNTDDMLGFKPGLTTINAEKEALGMRAVDQLLWRLDHPRMPCEKKLLKGKLIVRETTAPPNQK